MHTRVYNLSTTQEMIYSLPPEQAVQAAAFYDQGDMNTWEYTYGQPLTFGQHTVACGDWCAKLLAKLDPSDTLISLDGRVADPAPWQLDYLNGRLTNGYPRVVALKGKVGFSELGMHTRTADQQGIIALANPKLTYAYVLLADNTIIDGCLTLFPDGRFSLS